MQQKKYVYLFFVACFIFALNFAQAGNISVGALRAQQQKESRHKAGTKLRREEQKNTQAVLKPAQQKSVLIPIHAKKQFCLNVRGWAVPTEHIFAVFEKGLQQQSLGEESLTIVRFWLDHGFGYAIGALVEGVFPWHMPRFRQLVAHEYRGTNVICPLACTYRDYMELEQSLSSSDKQQLYTICRPNCHLKSTQYNIYDVVFCECLHDPELSQCEILSREDLKIIHHARVNQEASFRDYAFRSKGERFIGKNVETVNAMKKSMISQLTRTLRQ